MQVAERQAKDGELPSGGSCPVMPPKTVSSQKQCFPDGAWGLNKAPCAEELTDSVLSCELNRCYKRDFRSLL